MLTLCLNLNVIRSSPAPVPVGPSLNSNTAVAALAGIAVAAKIAEDECDDVGVSRNIFHPIPYPNFDKTLLRSEMTCVLCCMMRRSVSAVKIIWSSEVVTREFCLSLPLASAEMM